MKEPARRDGTGDPARTGLISVPLLVALAAATLVRLALLRLPRL